MKKKNILKITALAFCFAINAADNNVNTVCLTLKGHTRRVRSVAYNPSGNELASGSDDKTIRIWNPTTGELLRILEGHKEAVNSIAYNPAGGELASGSSDGTIKIWNPATGELIKNIESGNKYVFSVAYNPAGSELAVGSDNEPLHDGVIQIWNPKTGKLLRTLKPEGPNSLWRVVLLAYNKSGNELISGSLDGGIRIWNLETGKPIRIIGTTSSLLSSAAYNVSGNQVASGSVYVVELSGPIKLWDPTTGNLLKKVTDETSNTISVDALTYSPSGKELASGTGGGAIKLWDSATGNLLKTLDEGNELPTIYNSVNSLVYSPSGTELASGFWDGTIKIWKFANSSLTKKRKREDVAEASKLENDEMDIS